MFFVGPPGTFFAAARRLRKPMLMHNRAAQMHSMHWRAGHCRASVCAKLGRLNRIFEAPKEVRKNGCCGSASWLAVIHCGEPWAPDRALRISGIYTCIDMHFGVGR